MRAECSIEPSAELARESSIKGLSRSRNPRARDAVHRYPSSRGRSEWSYPLSLSSNLDEEVAGDTGERIGTREEPGVLTIGSFSFRVKATNFSDINQVNE